jgi:hypothetical protein
MVWRDVFAPSSRWLDTRRAAGQHDHTAGSEEHGLHQVRHGRRRRAAELEGAREKARGSEPASANRIYDLRASLPKVSC